MKKDKIAIESIFNGIHITYTFPNGHKASIIQHDGSYGHEVGKWEIMSPLTDIVEGYLTWPEIEERLDDVRKLKKGDI